MWIFMNKFNSKITFDFIKFFLCLFIIRNVSRII